MSNQLIFAISGCKCCLIKRSVPLSLLPFLLSWQYMSAHHWPSTLSFHILIATHVPLSNHINVYVNVFILPPSGSKQWRIKRKISNKCIAHLPLPLSSYNMTHCFNLHNVTGHFFAAKVQGMKVQSYNIGYGPKLISFNDSADTEFALRAFPLGRYLCPFSSSSLSLFSSLFCMYVLTYSPFPLLFPLLLLFSLFLSVQEYWE